LHIDFKIVNLQKIKNSIMKNSILTVVLGLAFTQATFAQEKVNEVNYNRWSIDVNAGISKPTAPFSVSNFTSDLNLFHADLGARYMFNNKFGLKVDFGMDSFENASSSLPFETKYYRTTLQGVVNLGRIFKFEQWTNTINLQAHTGIGYAFMTNDNINGYDNMANFIVGLTGQVKLSDRVALNADFSILNNIRQHYTFDGVLSPSVSEDRGFNGSIYNASLGLSIYLGKNKTHADWDTSNPRIDALEAKIAGLETKMLDSDNDGVADYLDAEPNTKDGATVDAKGRTIDGNGNKVDDNVEKFIDQKLKEVSSQNKNVSTIDDLINGGYINVYFDTNSSTPRTESFDAINFIVQYMRNNPNAKINVIGFADEVGNTSHNMNLSKSRAEKVKDIITKANINASRLSTTGQGEDTSVDASSKEARTLVRRVTFKLN